MLTGLFFMYVRPALDVDNPLCVQFGWSYVYESL